MNGLWSSLIFVIFIFPNHIISQLEVYSQCRADYCKKENANISSDGVFSDRWDEMKNQWYKVKIIDTANLSDKLLLIPTAQIDSVLCYVNNLESKPLYFGSKVHPKQRGFWDRQIVIPLKELVPNGNTIFLNVRNRSDFSVDLALLTSAYFKQKETRIIWLFGIYTGTIFIFILFQFLVFQRFKLFNFNFFYLMYLIATFLYFFTEFGFSSLYLWYDFPQFDETFTFIFILNSSLFLLLFVYDFFQTSLLYSIKWLVRAVAIVITLLLVFIVTGLFEYDVLYPFVHYGVLSSVIICFLFSYLICLIAIFRKHQHSKIIFISFFVLLFGAFLKPLVFAGLIEHNFISDNSAIVGHFFEVIFISAVMIDLGLKQIKQSQILQLENTLLEKTALTAQINPHFVFNSLNSVQYFMMNNEKEKASDFLSGYAKLIRQVLNAAHQKKISLAREIDFLNEYLRLEQMKSRTYFCYNNRINLEKVLIDSIKIYPMILQPFVENAVLHGVGSRCDDKGLIDLIFSWNGEYLIVEIIDNGKGFNQDLEISNNDSLGTMLTKKRIQITNQTNENNVEYAIPFPDAPIFKGTKVILRVKPI